MKPDNIASSEVPTGIEPVQSLYTAARMEEGRRHWLEQGRLAGLREAAEIAENCDVRWGYEDSHSAGVYDARGDIAAAILVRAGEKEG